MGTPAPVVGTREDRDVAANFKVEIDGAGDDIKLISGVSGISLESRIAESRQGGTIEPDFSAVDNMYGEVTITGTVIGQQNSLYLWHELALDGASREQRQRTMLVIPLRPDGSEKPYSWQLERCEPRTYTPGDFDATNQDVLSFTLVVQPTRARLVRTPGL